MKYTSVLAGCLLGFVSQVHAADNSDAEKARGIVGMGVSSCGEYVEARRNEDHGPVSKAMVYSFESWAQGAMSGNNLQYAEDHHTYSKLPDNAAMLVWLDNYCQAHPLKLFWMAVGNLYNSLPVVPVQKGK